MCLRIQSIHIPSHSRWMPQTFNPYYPARRAHSHLYLKCSTQPISKEKCTCWDVSTGISSHVYGCHNYQIFQMMIHFSHHNASPRWWWWLRRALTSMCTSWIKISHVFVHLMHSSSCSTCYKWTLPVRKSDVFHTERAFVIPSHLQRFKGLYPGWNGHVRPPPWPPGV